MSRRSNYKKTSTLNIKFLLSLQSKLALSKSMRNFSKIFDDAFKIINVRKLDFTSNAKNSKKMFESATMRSNAQKFKFSKSIKNFWKMLENVLLRLNVHVNAFIWQKSFEKLLMQDNRKISLWTNFVFQLINIQVVVLKKEVKNLFKKTYDESTRFMKCFIKEF